MQDVQGTLSSGRFDQPISFGIRPQFFPYSLSISAPDVLESRSSGNVQNLLETSVADDDALYNSDLNDVGCTENEICNKRISYAGAGMVGGATGQ